MSLQEELKPLIGLKIIKVDGNTLYFEDGTQVYFHPYETYVEKGE